MGRGPSDEKTSDDDSFESHSVASQYENYDDPYCQKGRRSNWNIKLKTDYIFHAKILIEKLGFSLHLFKLILISARHDFQKKLWISMIKYQLRIIAPRSEIFFIVKKRLLFEKKFKKKHAKNITKKGTLNN